MDDLKTVEQAKVFDTKREALIASAGDPRPLWCCTLEAHIGPRDIPIYGLATTELQFKRAVADSILCDVRKLTREECHRLMASALEDTFAAAEL